MTSLSSTYLCLDFRNVVHELKSPYQLKFSYSLPLCRIKLTSMIIEDIEDLGAEPYIYLKIGELGGQYLTPTGEKVFGKLTLTERRGQFLYYQPDPQQCCDVNLPPTTVSQLNVEFLNYQGQPIHLEQVKINRFQRIEGGLKFVTVHDHRLQTGDQVMTKSGDKLRIKVKSNQIFTVPKKIALSSSDQLVCVRSQLRCSLHFQVWSIETPVPIKKYEIPDPQLKSAPTSEVVSMPTSVPVQISKKIPSPLKYKQHKQRDAYQIFNLPKTSTSAEITAKYQELYLLTHPHHGGQWADFMDIQMAYYTLSDPRRRTDYDSGLGSTFDELTAEYRCDEKHYPKLYEKLPDGELLKREREFMETFEKNRPEVEKKILDSQQFNRDRRYVYGKYMIPKVHFGKKGNFFQIFAEQTRRANEKFGASYDSLHDNRGFGAEGNNYKSTPLSLTDQENSIFDLTRPFISERPQHFVYNPTQAEIDDFPDAPLFEDGDLLLTNSHYLVDHYSQYREERIKEMFPYHENSLAYQYMQEALEKERRWDEIKSKFYQMTGDDDRSYPIDSFRCLGDKLLETILLDQSLPRTRFDDKDTEPVTSDSRTTEREDSRTTEREKPNVEWTIVEIEEGTSDSTTENLNPSPNHRCE